MAATIPVKFRKGPAANLATVTTLVTDEALFTTDRKTLHVATSTSTQVPVVPAVDLLTALLAVDIDSNNDQMLIHDASATGVKEKKISIAELKMAVGSAGVGLLQPLLAVDVVPADDAVLINDASETGTDQSKKITISELSQLMSKTAVLDGAPAKSLFGTTGLDGALLFDVDTFEVTTDAVAGTATIKLKAIDGGTF